MPCAKEVMNVIYQQLQSSDWLDACTCASLQLAFIVTYNWLNVHQAAKEGNFVYEYIFIDFSIKHSKGDYDYDVDLYILTLPKKDFQELNFTIFLAFF